MQRAQVAESHRDPVTSPRGPREQILARLPVTEHVRELGGIRTAVLMGGEGLPMVLLHGPGEHATKWLQVIPELALAHRLVVPDLPGHGESAAPDGPLGPERMLAWLADLITQTCPTPPIVVGQILGGAIAARFAARWGDRLQGLILVDSLGLAPFAPAPQFGQALGDFLTAPSAATHDALWRQCAYDLDAMTGRMGASWRRIRAYNLDRARTPALGAAQQSLFQHFGLPAIAPAELARIEAPTTLIWGRHDLATPLAVAERASAAFGWPLHVIDDAADDPPMEQPQAFLATLRAVLGEG